MTANSRPLRSLFFGDKGRIEMVYERSRMQELSKISSLYDEVVTRVNFDQHLGALREAEVIFSTWGMPLLTEEQVASLSNLKLLLYAAGSVQSFAAPLINAGVRIVSAWRANAEPVAHFTLGQILLSLKGYYRNVREFDGSIEAFRGAWRGPGVYRQTVGLLGCGAVGRRVIELLRPFDLDVMVYDPFLAENEASRLGVRKVTIAEIFSLSLVVSNHLPDKPETVGTIGSSLLTAMRPGATFINTGRGATVVERELVECLAHRSDLTALLDVTFPEPMGVNSALNSLPNAIVSSHIAGATNTEVYRMADLCLEEFKRFVNGDPLQHEVSAEMLRLLA